MARLFNGTSDKIVSTIDDIEASLEWTIGAWIWMANAPTGFEPVVQLETPSGGLRQSFGVQPIDGAIEFTGRQEFSGNKAQVLSNVGYATGMWHLFVTQFDFATVDPTPNTIRLYYGNLSTPVTGNLGLSDLQLDNRGTGDKLTGGTTCTVGGRVSGTGWFDGRIALPFVTATRITVSEIEGIRLGNRSAIWGRGGGDTDPSTAGDVRMLLPLDSPTASQAEDMSGNENHGTVTGTTVAEDPPIPMMWGGAVA